MGRNDKRNLSSGGKIGMSFFLLIPVIFLGIGLTMTYNMYNVMMYGSKTVGTVTGYKVNSDSDGTTYCVRVKFRTKSGIIINHVNSTCSSWKPFEKGESAPVYYFEEWPHKVLVYEGWTTWVLPMVFTFMGGFFTVGILVAFFAPTGKQKVRQGLYDIIKRSEDLNRQHDEEFHEKDPYQEMPEYEDPDDKAKYSKRRGL